MPSFLIRSSLYIVTIICFVYVYLIVTNRDVSGLASWTQSASLQNFKMMFVSIVLEALPFILLGVIVSALLQAFVSEQMIQRFIPRNPLLGILYACIIGIIFPICECGMIPVMRRLMRKGMPLYIAVVFIVAGPILNPIVYASTWMAFRSRPEIVYWRMGLAFLCAAIIGLIVYRFIKKSPLKGGSIEHQHEHHHHEHDHKHHQDHHHEHQHGSKWNTVMTHASKEFFEMGKYLIFGAMLAGLVHTMLPRESLVSLGSGAISSHLFMMGFAYIISLCSTSDAFVASSFVSTFSTGSILTFLVFGPMLDFKGTLMLAAIFRKRFVIILSGIIFAVVLLASMTIEHLLL